MSDKLPLLMYIWYLEAKVQNISKEHKEPRLLIPDQSNILNPGTLYLGTWVLFKHLPNGDTNCDTIKDIISMCLIAQVLITWV